MFCTRAVCNAQAVGLTENARPLPRENGAGLASVSRETKGNCVPFPEQQDIPVDETGTLENVIGFPTPYAAFCRVPATTMREHLSRNMDVPSDVSDRNLQGSQQSSLVRLRPRPHHTC